MNKNNKKEKHYFMIMCIFDVSYANFMKKQFHMNRNIILGYFPQIYNELCIEKQKEFKSEIEKIKIEEEIKKNRKIQIKEININIKDIVQKNNNKKDDESKFLDIKKKSLKNDEGNDLINVNELNIKSIKEKGREKNRNIFQPKEKEIKKKKTGLEIEKVKTKEEIIDLEEDIKVEKVITKQKKGGNQKKEDIFNSNNTFNEEGNNEAPKKDDRFKEILQILLNKKKKKDKQKEKNQ